MAVNGKQKGNSYERACASFLSSLYSESFVRVPNSGAFVGASNSFRKAFLSESQIRTFKGDIIPGDSFPKLVIECKSYADFPFHQLFSGKVKILESWIEQCIATEDPGDLSILMMKFNRKGQFVAFKNSTPEMKTINSLVYSSANHGDWTIMEHAAFWQLNSETVRKLSA